MRKREIATFSTVLCCCMAALLAGCGGGSKSTGSSAAVSTSTGGQLSPASHAELAQPCAFATEAETVYRADSNALHLDFKNKPGLRRIVGSLRPFRERVQGLASKAGGQSATQLNAYAAALVRQEVVLTAIIKDDFKTAAAHAQNLNQELGAGKTALARICSGF